MALPAFGSLPKKQQMYILYGVPAAIAALLIFLTWKALGTLGPIDNAIDPSNKLPGFLQRNTGQGVWNEIVTTQSEIDQKDAVIREKPKLEADLAALQLDIKAAEERLPRETEKAEMRETIERLARDIPADTGSVELQSVQIVDGNDRGSDIHTITFKTELTGTMEGIIYYIDALEKNQRFMSVNSLVIKGGTLSVDAPNRKIIYGPHVVRMDIVTYVYTGGKK
ncbi:MAG: hypothetical protein H0V44_18360 [Planctomycetes bacterium]|nr:hypothetical protein [Planctomycetota bacterium]